MQKEFQGNYKKISLGRAEDLSKKKFTHLLPLYRIEDIFSSSGKKRTYWLCLCDCGNVVPVVKESLTSGKTKSCGCYRKETTSLTHSIDYTNKIYYNVQFLNRKGSNIHNKAIWNCKCLLCNNIFLATASDVVSGHIKSCGCIKKSYGEEYIKQLLNNNNISYSEEKTFSNCIFKDTLKKARFDFYINNTYLLEFDGKQHFYYQNSTASWNSKERFQKTHEHDEYKNQWCKDNNIPLIRIPYTKLDTLCIEDLMLETTKFRVV